MKLVRPIKMWLNGMHSKVQTGKHLSDNFSIQTGLMIFNFALEHAIRKVWENQVGPELNVTHQLLACAHDKNLLGDNIDVIEKNTRTLIHASREICREN
jgi:hypothetical protein